MATPRKDRLTADDAAAVEAKTGDADFARDLLASEDSTEAANALKLAQELLARKRRATEPKIDRHCRDVVTAVCVIDTMPWATVPKRDEDGTILAGEDGKPAEFHDRPLKHREKTQVRADVAALMEHRGQVVVV